jgi:excisionase family DNA binding protein
MNMENRLLNVEGSARYLGVRKSTIYSWAARKKIPSVKIGRRLLFDRKDLDGLIEKNKREVESFLDHRESEQGSEIRRNS